MRSLGMRAYLSAVSLFMSSLLRDPAPRGRADIRPPSGARRITSTMAGSPASAREAGAAVFGFRLAFLPSIDPTFTDFLQRLTRFLATSFLVGGMVRSPRAQQF